MTYIENVEKSISFCSCDFLKLFLGLSSTCGVTDCSMKAAVIKLILSLRCTHFSPQEEEGTRDQVVTVNVTMMNVP